MIKFEDVSKTYHIRKFHNDVLKDVSFEIPFGASVGICGANGAGKSTLMRLIAGVETATTGTITRGMKTSWPIGYTSCFQSSLTGADNARFIARIYGREIEPLLDYVEDFAQLGAYFYQPIATYSAGMSARLAFGISLAIDFDCYLVDEVTSAGDDRFRQKCEEALHYRRNNGTLVMISHDPHTLAAYCQTGAVLHGGRLTFYDTIQEAVEVHLYNQSMPIGSTAVRHVGHAQDALSAGSSVEDADDAEEPAESVAGPLLPREDVIVAWECFLRRVPDEEALQGCMALGTRDALVRVLINCAEFHVKEAAGYSLLDAMHAYEEANRQLAAEEQ